MEPEDFVARLTALRMKRNVSAREMSLSLGQNVGYINNIESGKALPSMTVFFYICDYFKISPMDFFNTESANPESIQRIVGYLKKLNDSKLLHIEAILKDLTE